MQAPPPSAWVCPLEPGVLWASCSWEGSSPAAAAEMAGEGHRWSRFRRGSASPDVPRTQSKEKKWNVNPWCISNLKSREATGGEKNMLRSKQNNSSSKQGNAEISRPEERSYLSIKVFSFSRHKEASREERVLGRWKHAGFQWWICHDQIFVAF